MLYHVTGLCPRRGEMSGCGFGIHLWPKWRECVAEWKLTQGLVNTAIENMGRAWLDSCGYGAIFDPDNCGIDCDKSKPPGPMARPLYETYSIRITWGEWGPEHITVPGNACGLDIDRAYGGPLGGKSLLPHNVDTIAQAHLLLVVFTWFAEGLILNCKLNYPSTPQPKEKANE